MCISAPDRPWQEDKNKVQLKQMKQMLKMQAALMKKAGMELDSDSDD